MKNKIIFKRTFPAYCNVESWETGLRKSKSISISIDLPIRRLPIESDWQIWSEIEATCKHFEINWNLKIRFFIVIILNNLKSYYFFFSCKYLSKETHIKSIFEYYFLHLNLLIVSLQKKNNREIKETEFPSWYSQRSLVLCKKNNGSAREEDKERMRKNRRILVDCSRWMGHLACSCTGLLSLWLQVSSKFRRQWTGITTFQRVCTIPTIGNTF